MASTAEAIAPSSITTDTERGWLNRDLDSPRARRQAYDSGKRRGAGEVINNPVWVDLVFRLRFLEAAFGVLCDEIRDKDESLARYEKELLEAYELIDRLMAKKGA